MNTPPRLAQWLLRTLVRADRGEEMAADLHESFDRRTGRSGPSGARTAYWLDVLSIIMRPAYWRRFGFSIAGRPAMIRTGLKQSVRSMRAHPVHALLNAAGLAAGLLSALFIGQYVRHELSFDRHHPGAERTYRVVSDYHAADRHWAPIGPPVGPAMAASIPGIESYTRFFPFESPVIVGEPDRQVQISLGGFADSTFFDLFGYALVAGDPGTALSGVGKAAIAASRARDIFGRVDVVGETLALEEELYTVSAVFEDPPSSTHLPVQLALSMETFYSWSGDWLESAREWAGFMTYIRLRSGVDVDRVEASIPGFVDTFLEGAYDGAASASMGYALEPVERIHLYSNREKEYVPGGDYRYVWTFGLAALVVLAIAMMNFVNLTTAQAGRRALEIGVRKSFGARRGQLIGQFLVEAVLFALVALSLTIVASVLLAPWFAQLSGLDLTPAQLFSPRAVLALGAVSLATGILAGLYPAWAMSGYRPVRAMGSWGGQPHGGGQLRRVLVVFQFTLSISLMAASLIVQGQLSFLKSTSLGFDRENVLRLELPGPVSESIYNNRSTFVEALKGIPGVAAVSQASNAPGRRYSVEGMSLSGSEEVHDVRVAWQADHAYPLALGLDLVEGRFFSEHSPADTNAWVINETARSVLGLGQVDGQILEWGSYAGPIVGVVRDFNFASLRDEVEPLVIPLRPGEAGNLLVRFGARDPQDILLEVTETMEALAPGAPVNYAFLADDVEAMYRRDDTLKAVVSAFAALAIVVACLGLFGLAAFAAARRSREIGIRMVLGATSSHLFALVSREFVIQVVIAFVASLPVVILVMRAWLSSFAYRIAISPRYFLLAGATALVLALATVSFQAFRAARADPVHVIRES